MQIQKLPPAQIPNGLQALMRNNSGISEPSDFTPGIIFGLDRVPRIKQLTQSPQPLPHQTSGLVVIPPLDVVNLFTDAQLGLIKSLTKALADSLDSTTKIMVDSFWLLFDAKRLFNEFNDPDHDKTLTVLKILGLSLGSSKMIDAALPSFTIPESLTTGIDFAVTSGESIYLGKQIPINEFLLSQNKWAAIPIQALKCGGLAIDDQTPLFQTLKIEPLPLNTRLPSLGTTTHAITNPAP